MSEYIQAKKLFCLWKNHQIDPICLLRSIMDVCDDDVVMVCDNIDMFINLIKEKPNIINNIKQIFFSTRPFTKENGGFFRYFDAVLKNILMFSCLFGNKINVVWEVKYNDDVSIFEKSFIENLAEEFDIDLKWAQDTIL